MRATRAILVAIAVSGAGMGLTGCAPLYHTYDMEAPDSPVHVERAQAQARAADFRIRMAEAKSAYDSGQVERAQAVLRDLIADDPTYGPAHRALGDISRSRGDWSSAESAFGRASRLAPEDFDAQLRHGEALSMLGRFSEALQAYHRALTVQPGNAGANLALATIYLQLDERRSALAYSEKAVELDPRNGAARANLGAVYERLGRYEEATGQYEVALEYLEPTLPLLTNLINAQLGAERISDAAATAERLVRIAPSADAYERLGWCQFQLGQHDHSMDAYRRALDLNPNHWRSLNGVGTNAFYRWRMSQNTDAIAALEARDAFRHSLRVNPNQPEIVRLMLRNEL